MPVKKKKVSKDSNLLDIKKLDILVDNTIVLQKSVVNLTESNNNLNQKITSLINLFEIASKSIDKIKDVESKEVDDLAKKLKEVVNQNKDLAEGVLALEKYIKAVRGDIKLEKKPTFK